MGNNIHLGMTTKDIRSLEANFWDFHRHGQSELIPKLYHL
jgi:hypothetical protein